jgi:hypothetical protein
MVVAIATRAERAKTVTVRMNLAVAIATRAGRAKTVTVRMDLAVESPKGLAKVLILPRVLEQRLVKPITHGTAATIHQASRN